ncbi:MAG: hypothetical protein KDD66_09420 [Bdellovibrionales bacterium]|nr:hypothetical protein [Bdellovibrionales bacterium]
MTRSEKGYTIVELLVVVSMTMTIMGISVYNLRNLERPLKTGSAQLGGFFKQARSKAIATTSAYRVYAISNSQVATTYGVNCDNATTTFDSDLTYNLPTELEFTSTAWEVCFSARGIANDNITVTMEDKEGNTSTVEVFLGGAVRIDEV